jgi:hypothetical protein
MALRHRDPLPTGSVAQNSLKRVQNRAMRGAPRVDDV